jgi:hypothetical protein
MNLALIVDSTKIESFYLKDGKSFSFTTNLPYQFPHSIKNECHIGFWSYPKLFGDGVFIKINENPLPDLDLDIIILSLELLNWEYSLQRIKNKYPNAVIVGTIKEPSKTKIDFLNQCDKIGLQYSKHTLNLNKETFWLPQPIDVNYIYDNFYLENKKLQLFQYNHHSYNRKGNTEYFCKHISKKYGIPIISKTTSWDNINQWKDFILDWRDSLFHINLDPEYQYGQQATQCAALGCVNIGGVNDSHFHLFPNTATNDLSILENEIEKCLDDETYLHQIILKAWDNVNQIYSLKSVKQSLIKNL